MDSDVIITIQQSGQAAALASLGRIPVVITDAVWDELTVNAAGIRQEIVGERLELLKAIVGEPVVIGAETAESLAIARLATPETASYGLGERSLIAYALHNEDVRLVLMDKLALHRATEELPPGRVFSFHHGLHVLEAFGLPRASAEAASSWWCRNKKPHRPPLWWTARVQAPTTPGAAPTQAP